MRSALVQFFQAGMLLLLAPLLAGFVATCRARLQNRRGAGVMQPWRNLRKLFSKEVVMASHASWIFRTAPYVVFTATVMAASVVPAMLVDTPLSLIADVIALVALLALSRFFQALAGMDIGTAFGGMGASREMTFAALGEPAMLMSIFVISLSAHSTNLTSMINHTLNSPFALHPSLAFALVAMLLVALAENGRIPIDNPTTHLELTMIHEAMILEYSGRHLALMEWAAMVKLLLFSTLIVDLFMPWGMAVNTDAISLVQAFGLWLLKVAGLMIALALAETGMAKLRLFDVPEYLSGAFVIAFLGLLSFYMLEVGA
ncbi:MAG: formate hydrogenlyase [Zetaproteobacteria bacterium CG_4_9_14_3_um_filter_49_83]|nr:MAG: formate hydrogenlyase [Zetaproteobacteria bacterium CG1_02_49_23]PIQ30124.1 MAG: formate hydrogenlyase [Zetaproteobacteria bacterium CG17_big_fil_post_rev_8_21_14_2_50_50_13]PIV31506.1 MAG: formate hydrogenlyase [Zetaproteobacteria bacterium CG02_land_8_20_14_3_00_50_9]PIY55928.1 MAG: formate hydrogenlyase [Zetaproteobacteria bacterium CG_4_10_14_0_8_um_filter_49_80]PJA36395.1 MAG: formate hydrogenlyase [Zetaproteobacteria bacterium CG_4_9_14_3_um_filter_49_83]